MNPTAPYRGAGRPESTYVIERLIDDAARELGRDRVALRRLNLIPASAMPYRTALKVTYDSGQFERGMDKAVQMADVAGFPDAPRGVAPAAASSVGSAWSTPSSGRRRLSPSSPRSASMPSGGATVLMGTKSQGQGHETAFKQVLHERLGLDPHAVRYVDGDTDQVAFGTGTFGSRSVAIGGSALWLAADKVIAKGRRIAAHLLEAAEADIVFADGPLPGHRDGSSRDAAEVARAAFQPTRLPADLEPGLYETGRSSRSTTPGRTAATSARSRSIRTPGAVDARRRTWSSTTWARSSIP